MQIMQYQQLKYVSYCTLYVRRIFIINLNSLSKFLGIYCTVLYTDDVYIDFFSLQLRAYTIQYRIYHDCTVCCMISYYMICTYEYVFSKKSIMHGRWCLVTLLLLSLFRSNEPFQQEGHQIEVPNAPEQEGTTLLCFPLR